MPQHACELKWEVHIYIPPFFVGSRRRCNKHSVETATVMMGGHSDNIGAAARRTLGPQRPRLIVIRSDWAPCLEISKPARPPSYGAAP